MKKAYEEPRMNFSNPAILSNPLNKWNEVPKHDFKCMTRRSFGSFDKTNLKKRSSSIKSQFDSFQGSNEELEQIDALKIDFYNLKHEYRASIDHRENLEAMLTVLKQQFNYLENENERL